MARQSGRGERGVWLHSQVIRVTPLFAFVSCLLEQCRNPTGFRHLDAGFRGAQLRRLATCGQEPVSGGRLQQGAPRIQFQEEDR